MVAAHGSAGGADSYLNSPLWVVFVDPLTDEPYWYNVQTHEKSLGDPDSPDEDDADDAPLDVPKEDDQEVPFVSDTSAEAPTPSSAVTSIPQLFDKDDQCQKSTLAVEQPPSWAPGQVPRHSWLDNPYPMWRSRPARVQRESDAAKTQYVEGHDVYNIWYGKYESDRFDKRDVEPASTKCDPGLDAGWTEADVPGAEASAFCSFFARGCCSMGPGCKYFHRVPSLRDSELCDVSRDIFGRQRHVNHRDDMGGVGSFNNESLTLFVGDLRFNRSVPDTVQQVEKDLWDGFGAFGEVEHVKVLPAKAIGFVRFKYRAAAEFALMAMDKQALGLAKLLRVKWALGDPHPQAEKRRRIEREDLVEAAVKQRIESMELTESGLAGLYLRCGIVPDGEATAPYPDTSGQYSSCKAKSTAAEEAEAESKRAAKLTEEAVDRMAALLAKIDTAQGVVL